MIRIDDLDNDEFYVGMTDSGTVLTRGHNGDTFCSHEFSIEQAQALHAALGDAINEAIRSTTKGE